MRMWIVDPKKMCRRHLMAEHLETHMFVGTLKKGKSVKGYLEHGILEVPALESRHDELAREIVARGYKHDTPLSLPKEFLVLDGHVDKVASHKLLCERCAECRARSDLQ